MDKKIVGGLVGVITALSVPQAGQAMPAPDTGDILRVNSYAELLDPIPQAATLLRAVDETRTSSTPAKAAEGEQVAQYYYHHHHHHHHHHWWRRFYHHHHHHHFYHHHHHHHYDDGY